MSLNNQFKIIKIVGHHQKNYILYDAGIIDEPSLELFNANYHIKADNGQNKAQQSNKKHATKTQKKGLGRANVTYFKHQHKHLVLKHYYRGGMVAKILKDKYFGVNLEKTRAFREWRLLKKMQGLKLPVPVAIAARVIKNKTSYHADLITEELQQTKTLADALIEGKVSTKTFGKIGATIAAFHQHNIYHADLNARNILLSNTNQVYLIDFDNSDFRSNTTSWKLANLARLKRSLLKFKTQEPVFYFLEKNWDALLKAYKIN